MFMQNFIKLSAAVHELSCTQTFSPYHAMAKNPKIQSCDLDLRHLTLKLNRVRAVVKMHVPQFVSTHYRIKRTCSKLLHNAELLSAVNFLTTKLVHSKLKCGLFSIIISLYNSQFSKLSVFMLRVPRGGHKRLDDDATG